MIKMTKTTVLILLLLIFTGIQLSSAAPYISNSYENTLITKLVGFRLPTNTAPILYTLTIEPNMEDEEFSFKGESNILFQVLTPTPTVVLHVSQFLDIDKSYTNLRYEDDSTERPVAQRWNPNLQFYSVRFRHELKIGNYSIEFRWKGYPITHEGKQAYEGFFRALDRKKYDDDTYVAVTHFQPMSARSAFPCWDEPALKAQFDIAIRHHTNYTVLSNMPIKEITDVEEDKVWTFFERTPLMSTYLVAFALAPYESHNDDFEHVAMWVAEEKMKPAKIAFEISRMIPLAMERYTGIPYSLPKMDGIIVPYYSSDAIENWGLIMYSNDALFDPDEDDVIKLDYAMYLTSHEIVHQWFGNLVTPAWWDDLWLSEAFAQYFSFKILDDVIHKWNSKDMFASIIINKASYHADRSRPNHPIRWTAETEEEVEEMFSSVTYDKGGGVVRMLEYILTEKTFQSGIRKYFQKYQFSSATTDNLWKCLQEAHNEKRSVSYLNIKELMDPWLDQTGYPLLNVTREYRTGFITITQTDAINSESGNLWAIPINYATSTRPSFESTEPTQWMRNANESLILYGIDKDDWIILNVQQTAFYRVNYDWENWRRLSSFLNTENFHQIHVINRAQLLYDIIYFSYFDERYFEILLDTVTYLHREINYLPWHSITTNLDQCVMVLINTPSWDMFKRFSLYLMNNIVNHIGFDEKAEDDHLTRLARKVLLPWACVFGHSGCRATAPIKLNEIFSGEYKKRFDPKATSWIYCTTLRDADATVWDMVMNAHFANPREQPAFVYLGCTNNQALIMKYLNLAMADNATLLCNEVADGLKSLIAGPGGNYNFALNFWTSNIDEISEYFEKRNSSFQLNNITRLLASFVRTVSQFEKFTVFLREQTEEGKMDRALGNSFTKIARESMKTGERASAMFNSIIQKKPYLMNILHSYAWSSM